MQGKIVLVTGAAAGCGARAAEQIAALGARVFVADAASVADNVALAEDLCRRVDRLDVLINNAGGSFDRRSQTSEGYETTLALNFLGPVALTQHLLRLLGRSESARIINVVSGAFQTWKGDPFEDLQGSERYDGSDAYARAQLLKLLFTLALARDLAETRIRVNVVTRSEERLSGRVLDPGLQRRAWEIGESLVERAMADSFLRTMPHYPLWSSSPTA